jgi:hypothetical protein
MKKVCFFGVVILFLAGYAVPVIAFHDGGVARCNGCHTMHNSQDGALVDPDSPTGNPYLLIDATPTDVCLSCHASFGQFSSDGQTRGPGGDFYWLTQDVTWVTDSVTYWSYGREHGHNIVSPGYGLVEDGVLTTAPGGTFMSAYMGCNSCHDPHGNPNFRMLYTTGESPANYPGGYPFTEPAPVADGNSVRTRIGEAGEEITGQHTAYTSGMSDWCANCHAGMHSDLTTNFVHPVGDTVGSTISSNYNAYVTTGDLTGSFSTAYMPLAPFEDAANTTTSTTGTVASSRVMCLSCHRAHASPYSDAGRWDFNQTLLGNSHPAGEPYMDHYDGNPLDLAIQRSLCNKCHLEDA